MSEDNKLFVFVMALGAILFAGMIGCTVNNQKSQFQIACVKAIAGTARSVLECKELGR